MEGPTPVSALIHAATMVTAGVYLIARSNPIFDAAPAAQLVVLDRRRGHAAVRLHHRLRLGRHQEGARRTRPSARSATCSWPSGSARPATRSRILHLLAHGFFKADLFLGAGSVMHAHGRRGRHAPLRRPVEGHADHLVTFGLGYLAIIGFPPLSGFFTKDKIIEAAFDKGGTSGGSRRPARCSAPGSPRST